MKPGDLFGWLGWGFCEFSFRWFRWFDVPYDNNDYRWYHHISYFIGQKSYAFGCRFYNMEESYESR